MEQGYIKLYRSVDTHDLLSRDNTSLVVFIKLLLSANWKSGEVTIGRSRLAAACNMKPSTVYSSLKRLQKSNVIQMHSNSTSTRIFICNWGKYQQGGERAVNDESTNIVTIQEERIKKKNIVSVVDEDEVSKKSKLTKRDLLSILNRITGRNFRTEPRGISVTADKFTDEEVEKALANLMRDDWHREKIHRLRSDYLLRASTIDSFLNADSDQKKQMLNYKIQGSTVKATTPNKGVPLTRAELLKREYENG